MFKEIRKDGTLVGHLFQLRRGFAFFGAAEFQKPNFAEHFPDFQFQILKQIHSANLIESPTLPIEADGHWSRKKSLALLIQTADCVPLMIETPERVVALHAGWRGVEQNILGMALKGLDQKELEQSIFVAGPHIATESFEVGKDVADRLLESDPLKDPSVIHTHPAPEKRRVDLQKILIHQAQEYVPEAQIHFLNIDTFKSDHHHSFRRDGPGAGRIYSFIVSTD